MIAILVSVLGSAPHVRARIVLICCCAAVLGTAGCGGGSGPDGGGGEIVAAFYPLAYAAERIAPRAVVENLTPAGTEPHDLELGARDVEELRDAKLVLYLGRGFQPAVEDAVAGRDNAVDLLAGEEGRDPHVWLDPRRFASVARRIAAALGTPAAARPLVADLESLDEAYRRGLASCRRRELVTSHAAFGYLADAYGLDQLALTGVSPEAEPGPRTLEALAREVAASGATTVFVEPLVSPALAETVSRETGARTAVLDPLEGLDSDLAESGADYLSVMRANLAALRVALGCR
jgi:zinc transport system substrate-binding protein